MNWWIVRVDNVDVVGRLRCSNRRRMRSEGFGGGDPLRVLIAAAEVAVQLKESHRGGTVKGVPCAAPKCC